MADNPPNGRRGFLDFLTWTAAEGAAFALGNWVRTWGDDRDDRMRKAELAILELYGAKKLSKEDAYKILKPLDSSFNLDDYLRTNIATPGQQTTELTVKVDNGPIQPALNPEFEEMLKGQNVQPIKGTPMSQNATMEKTSSALTTSSNASKISRGDFLGRKNWRQGM